MKLTKDKKWLITIEEGPTGSGVFQTNYFEFR
jgi:hypothetical protein